MALANTGFPLTSRPRVVSSSKSPSLALQQRSKVQCNKQWLQNERRRIVCHATLDDDEFQDLLKKLEKLRPELGLENDQAKLSKALDLIDQANSADPKKVLVNGVQQPYRRVYSQRMTDWVTKLDPSSPDGLLCWVRGSNIESWRLSEIRREDYAPNASGDRQWELDRKKWVANRLVSVMKDVGYSERTTSIVFDLMMEKNIPDPRDLRMTELVGAFGLINYRLLELVRWKQMKADADVMVVLEYSFKDMFDNLPADEVLAVLCREFGKISLACSLRILNMKWTPVERKLILKALPPPKQYRGILGDLENMSAASVHPGDWRFQNFDYD